VIAAYALHLADAVQTFGGAGAQLLHGLGLSRDELCDPSARIEMSCFIDLVAQAIELTGEPGLGILIGAHAPVSRMGMLGYAAMTAGTLRETLALLVRFLPLISTAAAFHMYERADHRAVLELEERVPFGVAREVIVFTLFTSFQRVGTTLTGVQLPVQLELGFCEPPYFARLSHQALGETATVRFGAAGHLLNFDAALLDLPLLSADPAAVRAACFECERQLAALGTTDAFVERVRRALFRDAEEPQSMVQLAERFCMTERTLKRRLAERGTSYSHLVDTQRHDRALELLRTAASVEDIAVQLGYSDAANFTRAFRRWTGQSPRSFRASGEPNL
jgi:AraC-like DNA-binding protein